LSLIGHSADVAAVLLALLERPVIARRLARLLGRATLTERERSRLAALAALHDVGKISQGFQNAPFPSAHGARGHVQPFLSLLRNIHCDVEARKLLARLEGAGGLGLLVPLLGGEADGPPLQAALAHHGSLPDATVPEPERWRPTRDHDPAAACRGLVDAITQWFPAAIDIDALDWNARFGHAFAGLLTLADWLGSDEGEFPMAGEEGAPDGAARFSGWSLPRARALLERRLLAPERARAACAALPWEIAPLTGFATASAAQAAMLALPPAPAEGRICLIEDETGSGKTEAALIHFLRLFAEGAVDGMYFALPTRAAAVQIHGRIERRLKHLLGDDAPRVVLAVPGYLDAASEAAAGLPDEAALWPEQERDARWASERPKRYLAACVAVGTIDQALMGALQVRHAQLRSAALLRLLLVVDEVHATDVYMNAILRNLLDQHRRAGGHALLMSATLGAQARRWLLEPSGTTPVAAPQDAMAARYPAVWTDRDGMLAAPPQHAASAEKSVRVQIDPQWNDPAPAVAAAVDAASRGARVLVIRNTVRDVVATQRALEAVAPAFSLTVGDVLAPHHARYAPEDRRRLDAALEAALGAGRPRVGGSVTITSQTAEQSLDIDADLLITDLCPADVLLQRIGRLHRRRDRTHVAGFEDPRVIVLAPTEAELAASLGAKGEMKAPPLALGLVYADLLGVVATRRAVAAMGVLRIPTDNRRLVEAATHPGLLGALAEELGGRWLERGGYQTGLRSAHENEARHARLRWDENIQPLPSAKISGQETNIRTRLGLDDRLVELPPGTVGPFGGTISRVTIPGRWLTGVSFDAAPKFPAGGSGEILVDLDGRTFVYDRLGLRPQ
jgi:CRISPR-associated endonuclease/helicase Cas3